jgi:hypothetical protein
VGGRIFIDVDGIGLLKHAGMFADVEGGDVMLTSLLDDRNFALVIP